MINNHATLIIRKNMYLRWMIRQDNAVVDFGIWKNITAIHSLMSS